MKLRQITVISQDVLSEGGRELATPCRRVAACGVLHNPYAGGPPVDDFSELVDLSVEAGHVLTARALEALGTLSRAAMARRSSSAQPAISNTAPA